jgi:hypothetical protein
MVPARRATLYAWQPGGIYAGPVPPPGDLPAPVSTWHLATRANTRRLNPRGHQYCPLDRFEGRCWLHWQANSPTVFGGVEVSAVITPVESGWDAHGHLVNDSDEREVFHLSVRHGSRLHAAIPGRQHGPGHPHPGRRPPVRAHRVHRAASRQIDHRVDL